MRISECLGLYFLRKPPDPETCCGSSCFFVAYDFPEFVTNQVAMEANGFHTAIADWLFLESASSGIMAVRMSKTVWRNSYIAIYASKYERKLLYLISTTIS